MPDSTEGGVTESARVQGGPVVLDIGGDIGALIVYLPDSFAGSVIEIGYADSDKPFTHTGVHRRSNPNGEVRLTAVYPELTTGDYQLWHPTHGSPLGPVVHVEGGAVAELNLLELDAEPVGAATVHSHGHTH